MRVLTVLLVLALATPVSYSQTRQSLENQRKQALKEIEETDRFLKETLRSQSESEAKLNILTVQVMQFNRLIGSIKAEIDYFDRQIKETTNIGNGLTREIEKMKLEYAELVGQAYKNRGKYNKLVYVLSSKDFNEAYRRMKYFQQYSEFRKKQVAEIIVKQEELNGVIVKLNEQKAEKAKLLEEHRMESKKLELVEIEYNDEIKKLKSKEKQLRTQLADLKKRDEQLQKDIENIIAAEAKKRNTTTTNLYGSLTPEERLVSNKFKDNKGKLPWPVERGVITGNFGKTYHKVVKDFEMNNPGIDFTTVANAEVRVVFDGEVINVAGIQGGNITVVVRHGSFITAYQNLVEVRVKAGDKIKSKDTIGKVYTENGADNAILKFVIYEENIRQNPEHWIVKR